ncbi:MAG TPA: lamin tail domain-containing protein, partial [Candidatus Deferrimicrobium sp.]|nr:lamin tail domain-containing protein [Candidatus Deferrimicrobium sp.]
SLVLGNLETGTVYYFNVAATDKNCNGPAYSKVYTFKPACDGGDSGGGGGSGGSGGSGGAGMVISEIAANPAGSFNDEYIELYNASNQPIDIKDWVITVYRNGASNIVLKIGSTGDYRGNTVIQPGGFYVITRGTVGYADKTMYDGFYLNRLFYVDLKKGTQVMDAAGKKNDYFLPDTNYELKNITNDNSSVASWLDKGGSYKGTAGSL